MPDVIRHADIIEAERFVPPQGWGKLARRLDDYGMPCVHPTTAAEDAIEVFGGGEYEIIDLRGSTPRGSDAHFNSVIVYSGDWMLFALDEIRVVSGTQFKEEYLIFKE